MNRSTILFTLIALSLFAYITLVDTKEKGTREREAAEKKLFELTSSKIDHLTLIQEEVTIEIAKKGSEWSILKPISYPADTSSIEQILSELEFVETRRSIPSSEIENLETTLKQWGLSTPTTHIIARGEGKTYELIVGRKVAVNDLYYAKKSLNPNDPVELISSFSRNNFSKKISELRSKDVFKLISSNVQKISIRQTKADSTSGSEQEISLENDAWSLQKPIKARGDREQVNSWISNLLGIKAVRFISEDNSNLNLYGLSTPHSQIQITLQNKPEPEVQTLLIGAVAPDQPKEVYAKKLHSNTVFTIPQEAVQKLMSETNQWRSPLLIPPSIVWSEINTLKIENKGKTQLFTKDNQKWKLAGATPLEVDTDKMVSLFTSLQDLKATQFIKDSKNELKKFGLDKPSLRLVFEGKRGEEALKFELLLGKSDKNVLYACTSLDPFIYGVLPTTPLEWIKENWQWRNLQVLSLAQESTPKMTVHKKGSKTTLTAQPQSKWGSEDSSKTVSENEMNSFWTSLSALRGLRWVSATSNPSFELQQPALRIEISTTSGIKNLKIGSPLPTGGRAAQVDGVEAVFEISEADYNHFNQELLKEIEKK